MSEGQSSSSTSIEAMQQMMQVLAAMQQQLEARRPSHESGSHSPGVEPEAALTTGLRTVARSMTNWNAIGKLKRCDYGASGLDRVAYIKKCMNNYAQDDYEEAWTTMNARSSDVPDKCKTIISEALEQRGRIVKTDFLRVAAQFVFRKRHATADSIADAAAQLIKKKGTIKAKWLHEYYGIAKKAWNCVLFAYTLEHAEDEDNFEHVPARSTTNEYVKSWCKNLPMGCRQNVMLIRTQTGDGFSLENAYNAAQDYIESQHVSDDEVSSSRYIEVKKRKRHAGLMAVQLNTRVCRFYQRGQCRHGTSCKFKHEKNEPESSEDSSDVDKNTRPSNKSKECKKCGSNDHTYSKECPKYTGCFRCHSKEHTVHNCTESCTACKALPRKPCKPDCSTRNKRLSFRR